MFFGHRKQCFTAIPRTKKARRFTGVCRRIKRSFILHKSHSIRFAMRFQVFRITLIRNIRHHHMNCNDRKARFVDTCAFSQQLYKRQRIFPARQSDEYSIPLFYQPILHHSFVKPPFNAANGFLFFGKLCHIFKNRLQK